DDVLEGVDKPVLSGEEPALPALRLDVHRHRKGVREGLAVSGRVLGGETEERFGGEVAGAALGQDLEGRDSPMNASLEEIAGSFFQVLEAELLRLGVFEEVASLGSNGGCVPEGIP